jgi:cytochrome c-type biogenesis protein CcmH/NrfG
MFRTESHAVYGWTKEEIFQRSLEQFRKARDLAPQNFELASGYAETFYMMPKPDWQEAYAAWKFCLNQPVNDSQRQLVYTHLARTSMRLERFEEASEWASKLTSPGPGSLRPLLERLIAEASKAAGKSPGTNSPTTAARDDGGK